LGYYTGSNPKGLDPFGFGKTPGFLTPEKGTNSLSRNVGKNYHYSCKNPDVRSSDNTVNLILI